VADPVLATLGEGTKTEQNLFIESKARNETLLMEQMFLLQLLLQKIANVNTNLKCLFSTKKCSLSTFLALCLKTFWCN